MQTNYEFAERLQEKSKMVAIGKEDLEYSSAKHKLFWKGIQLNNSGQSVVGSQVLVFGKN